VPPNSSQSEVITIFRTLSRWIVLCHIRTTHSDFWLQPAEFGGSRASIHIHGNLLLDSLFVTALRLAVGSIYYRTLTRLNSCPIAKDLLPFARLLLYQRIYRKNTSGRFTCVPSLINRTFPPFSPFPTQYHRWRSTTLRFRYHPPRHLNPPSHTHGENGIQMYLSLIYVTIDRPTISFNDSIKAPMDLISNGSPITSRVELKIGLPWSKSQTTRLFFSFRSQQCGVSPVNHPKKHY